MRPALAIALALALPAAARAELEDPGPYQAVAETDTVQAGPSQVQATVCLPSADGPRPTIVLATNLLESKDVLAGLCLHLATHGFVAAVPDLGYVNTDADSIAQTLLDTQAFLRREGARSGSRFFGRVDDEHAGVLGFNTGAMGALRAAALDDTLSAAILVDPDDVNGQARNAATQVAHVPVLFIEADSNPCNGNGSGSAVYDQLAAPRSTLHVYAASDCDGEWPASQSCQATCGPSHDYGAKYVRRFVTADAAFFVGCDASAQPYAEGGGITQLAESRFIDGVDSASLPKHCGPFVTIDAGAPDAGAEPSGCGSSGPPSFAPALGLVVLAAAAARRRQRQAT